MSALVSQLGEQIMTDFLAAFGQQRISQPIVCDRDLVPKFIAGKLPYGEYNVLVSPISEKIKRISRSQIRIDFTIEIGVLARLEGTTKRYTDPGQQLLEELSCYHFDYGLGNDFPAQWIENDVYFFGDPDVLAAEGAFFGLWAATFEGTRDRIGT